MANEPRYDGGMTDIAASAKVMQIIQLCATFHLPISPASTILASQLGPPPSPYLP